MNKIFIPVLILISLFNFFHKVESHPLLGETLDNLLNILGIATYYDVEAGVGSCGIQSSSSEYVVAVNHGQMNNGINPNKNPLCNTKVKINGPKGKNIKAAIVDTCPGCKEGCLDMSTSLFEAVCGGLELGICSIKWDFD